MQGDERREDRGVMEIRHASSGLRPITPLLLRKAVRTSYPSEASLLLLGCPLSARRGIGRHCGADELFESSFVDLLPFTEVDRTPRVPFQAGIEELLRVADGGSASEGELHDLLVQFPCADDAVMGPDGGSPPFPLLLYVGVGIADELTDMSEGLSSPIPQLLNPPGDVRRSGLAIGTSCRFHVIADPSCC